LLQIKLANKQNIEIFNKKKVPEINKKKKKKKKKKKRFGRLVEFTTTADT